MATNIRWTVTSVDVNLQGTIRAMVSLAVEGDPVWATVGVTVTSTMTSAEMLAALRDQITPHVNEHLQVGLIKQALTGATGVEAF